MRLALNVAVTGALHSSFQVQHEPDPSVRAELIGRVVSALDSRERGGKLVIVIKIKNAEIHSD